MVGTTTLRTHPRRPRGLARFSSRPPAKSTVTASGTALVACTVTGKEGVPLFEKSPFASSENRNTGGHVRHRRPVRLPGRIKVTFSGCRKGEGDGAGTVEPRPGETLLTGDLVSFGPSALVKHLVRRRHLRRERERGRTRRKTSAGTGRSKAPPEPPAHAARHASVTMPRMPNRRPHFELIAPSASPEEAAAVVAALERFMRATAPVHARRRRGARRLGPRGPHRGRLPGVRDGSPGPLDKYLKAARL